MAQAGALPAAAGPVAPPQPVAVTVATARVTADLPLLAKTRFILDNLPFLPWDVERTADGTLVRFRLGHHDAMASFVALCRFVRNPATIQALGQNDTFTLAWNGAAWSRVLTAYSAAGLFARPIANQTELLDRLGELVVPQANAGALVITHSDIFSCEPFDAPPPAAGGRGQRSGGRGAGASRRGDKCSFAHVSATVPGPTGPNIQGEGLSAVAAEAEATRADARSGARRRRSKAYLTGNQRRASAAQPSS